MWLGKLLLTIVTIPTKWLVKATSTPTDIEGELGIDKSKPIVYLLRTHSITDLIALKMSAKTLGLPKPTDTIEVAGESHASCLFLQKPRSVLNRKKSNTDILEDATELFKLHRENPDLDIQIVPVSILWGRAPDKTLSSWSDIIANQVSPSWLRKFFIVLFLGRDNFVCYSKAVSSRAMVQLKGDDQTIAHKLVRVAGTHFHRRQQTLTGPNILERHELYNGVLGSEFVLKAIDDRAKTKNISQQKAKLEAKKYVDEIAADYRPGLIRLGERILTKIWNKIYNGIEVNHAEKVRNLAQNGHEIIYVPCHRSHMDYLLLTYVIYHQGLVTPRIAAGINLNFPPVGGILRKAGAFYLRRSFAGNKLYTAVFREYLELLFKKGNSVKYFPEGGRSRTGRLLPPKTGMLAMTMQAVAKGINRPVSIVPVYIGYEHVMEVSSYVKELNGKSKQKESFFQIFSAIKKLKNYGTGFLNFGEPINLTNFLDQQAPNWREEQQANVDKKPQWLTPVVNSLATEVMSRINQAAAVNGMALCSLCLLSSNKHAMSRIELETAMDHFIALLKDSPYSEMVTIPETSGAELLANTLKLNKLTVTEDSFGEIVSLKESTAVAQTYYRNNILHLFALPGLIAAIVFAHDELDKSQIVKLTGNLYPLLKQELFMHMDHQEAQEYIESLIDQMLSMGLLVDENGKIQHATPSSHAFYSVYLLNRSIQETLQRYALVLTLLCKEEQINRKELEKQSTQFAARLSALNGINSPEFFDKKVLATFINALKENGLVEADEQGQLSYAKQSDLLKNEVTALIEPEIALRLQQI
ncbi:glycerol-3-phosphate 1-O-acyltransferase PlsB [Paraglaciecola sp. 2405UD69-4]|uniref:glycerol-3-phosphate 1-O-acyltransferase PlsB n=1 Tax=Paraglaciecola sp. 2405UD69-4 TaxID=3391836 RepID=UPI0039C970A0